MRFQIVGEVSQFTEVLIASTRANADKRYRLLTLGRAAWSLRRNQQWTGTGAPGNDLRPATELLIPSRRVLGATGAAGRTAHAWMRDWSAPIDCVVMRHHSVCAMARIGDSHGGAGSGSSIRNEVVDVTARNRCLEMHPSVAKVRQHLPYGEPALGYRGQVSTY